MTDLSNLPEIVFVETRAAVVEREIISTYEEITGRTLAPGNPERLFCETVAYIIAMQRSQIDQAAKQNMLAYAGGNYLDHLGALLDVSRLEASRASCTIEFNLAEALAFAVSIPAGTRVTPGGQVYFFTIEPAEIAIGETTVEVTAEAEIAGAAGNGYVAGQIDKMVDVIAYVQSVQNTTITLGGSDREGDAHFRGRIQLSPEKFSTAGPVGAYQYWAKTAHQDIVDVSVRSPSPGVVDVRPLMAGGEIPTSTILEAVSDVLSDRTRRPLTDDVTVQAPEPVSYDLEITYYLPRSQASLASSYQAAVSAAVEKYVLWQRSALGRDINPSELISRVMAAGAKRVEVTAPAFVVLELYQVAIEDSVSVIYGGVEDE